MEAGRSAAFPAWHYPFTKREELTMRRQIGVGILLALGLLILGVGRPEQVWSENPCSLRTLKGTYLYHCAGVYLVNGQPVHFAFSGKDQYNGDGTMTGVYSLSDNGTLSHHVSYSGTYTVNPDCTGAFTTKDENGVVQHADLFFGHDGDEVSFVLTDPGFVDSGVERRVSK
jgi:hypothetical protein